MAATMIDSPQFEQQFDFLNRQNEDGYGTIIGSQLYPTVNHGNIHSLKEPGGSFRFDQLSHPKPLEPLDQEIIDIRRDNSSHVDLRAECIEGLTKPFGSKRFPALFLWDKQGHNLYNRILATKHYYPHRVENELFQQRIPEIARKISSSGSKMLLELGAGNLEKITPLLSALEELGTPLTYYALDVDRAQLEIALSGLRARTNLLNITLCGLLGTYEDAAYWLSTAQEAQNTRKTVIWLGNSIANLKPHEAGELLASFTNSPNAENSPDFIVAVDGCRDRAMIECAYDTPGGQSRQWVKYALTAARKSLGPEAAELLDDDNWRFEGRWDAQTRRFENFLTVAKDLTATIDGSEIRLERGEMVGILGSGKWSKADVRSVCAKQSLDIVEWWNSSEVDYGKANPNATVN
jgi:EasF-like predicted methyltransferase